MGDKDISVSHSGSEPAIADAPTVSEDPKIVHEEGNANQPWAKWKWSTAKSKDADTAMALFDDPNELHEEIDPAEARRLLWKIDFMILPYLAVCYAFFYIDKVCRALFWLLSHAIDYVYRQR